MTNEYDQKITVVISAEFLQRNLKTAAERYEKDGWAEGKNPKGYVFEFETQMQELDIDKNHFALTTMDREGSYMSFVYKINSDMWGHLAQECTKKLNKLRALLEAAT